MGTNFYGRIIPSKPRKEELKKSIDDNDFKKIKDLYKSMFSVADEFTDGSIFHLGKHSKGWKFLFDANFVSKYNKAKDRLEYLPRFVLTKQGLLDFLKNMVVVDEYHLYSKYDLEDAYNPNNDPDESGLYTPEQFFEMVEKYNNANNLCDNKFCKDVDGTILNSVRSYNNFIENLKEDLPYLKDTIKYDGYSDFYNDGLRWSCFSDFS